MPNRLCTRTALELPWLLNGTLSAPDRRRVREHLISCPACRAQLAETRATLAMFADGTARSSWAEDHSTAAPRHRATESTLLHHPFWAGAAAAAALLVTLLWTTHGLGRGHESASRVLPARPVSAATDHESQRIFTDSFESGNLSGWRQQL
jgi:anti-sigma factor RsiW